MQLALNFEKIARNRLTQPSRDSVNSLVCDRYNSGTVACPVVTIKRRLQNSFADKRSTRTRDALLFAPEVAVFVILIKTGWQGERGSA